MAPWVSRAAPSSLQARTNVFSLEASARLHGLDVAAYFRDIIHVLPYWPRDPFLELSPRDWAQTRARLHADTTTILPSATFTRSL